MTSAVSSPIVDRLLRSVANPPPDVRRGAELLARIDDPGTGARDLANLVSEHPVARAQLFALAESSMVHHGKHAVRLVDAITGLGFDVVRSVAVHWVCGALDGGGKSLPADHWKHAIASASAAGQIGDVLRLSRSYVVSAALVQDVGRVLLLRSDARRYRQICNGVTDAEGLVVSERRTYGCDHAVLSGSALKILGAPEPVVAAVLVHHDPARRDAPPLTIALAVGDLVAQAALAEAPDAVDLERVLVTAGLGYLRPDRLVERVVDDLERAGAFLRVA